MTISKAYQRDILGLSFIISSVLATLYILLDISALFAYLNHEEKIASIFIHESIYFLIFLIPPYFIAKYMNRKDTIK
ncbi:D-fructose-6-phosphate amidotransferase [Aliivibrio fischeri]|nr:D-fructose-6-phosphate amidotransferase [Aliivibrio fischeri]MUK25105.1 D-fructose-6-phosphate amidotransferase [Aliivibrio fischeri]MUK32243.1 D-fructose-6-phosphate amidotransferase [Aliivibrio fischeri]